MENSKDIKRLEISVATLLMFIPLILRLVDGTWRTSISDYVYSEKSYVFGFLLTLAGSMFLYNGIGYKRHWYNGILGISLFAVVLTPHLDYPIAHYTFAVIFFLGSATSVWLSSNIKLRWYKTLISVLVAISLLLHFVFDWYSLLIAECLAIVPISNAFIVKSFYK